MSVVNKSGRRYLSEFIGTFALVFAGTGAIMINEISGGQVGHLGIGITFGAIIMIMIYCFGDVSGAHFNPAVTLAFFASGRLPARELVRYPVFQIAGALAASLVLKGIFNEYTGKFGATLPAGPVMQSFYLEIMLTFLLVFVILFISARPGVSPMIPALAIGATVGLEAIFAGPISGASMNPARSISPALVSLNIEYLWIYLTAPFLGAAIAAATWRYFYASLED